MLFALTVTLYGLPYLPQKNLCEPFHNQPLLSAFYHHILKYGQTQVNFSGSSN